MRIPLVPLLALVACAPTPDGSAFETDAGYKLREHKVPLRGKRQIGCREHLLRLSISMCDPWDMSIPAQDATATDLWVVGIRWMPKDACFERWWTLARTCPGEVTP